MTGCSAHVTVGTSWPYRWTLLVVVLALADLIAEVEEQHKMHWVCETVGLFVL